MKTVAKITILLFVFFCGCIQGGFSQIGTTTNNDDPPTADPPMSCPHLDNCLIKNYNFGFFLNPNHGSFIYHIIPDSVCEWNSYSTLSNEDFNLEVAGPLINMDLDINGQKCQIFQRLPDTYDTTILYHFLMKYDLTALTTDEDNELLVCLTNKDPSSNFPPFNDADTLLDSWNDHGDKVQRQVDVIRSIGRYYKYIVVWCRSPEYSDEHRAEFYWLQIRSIDLCGLPLFVDPGPDRTTCSGDTTRLGGCPGNNTGSGGTPPYSYCWSLSRTFNNCFSTNECPKVHPTVTTKYYVKVTDASFIPKSKIDSVLVTIANICLTAEAGANVSICPGDSVMLGGKPTEQGYYPPYTYSWTSIPPGYTSSQSNPYVKPTAETSYILRVADSHFHNASDTISVIVKQKCNKWPRFIHCSNSEDLRFACDSIGDLLAAIDGYDTIISFINDTTINNPYSDSLSYFNSLVFFNKNSNRVWYRTYWAGSSPVDQLKVDNQGNSYVLFASFRGYSFYNGGPSMIRPASAIVYRTYLAKIDIRGVVNWILEFAPGDTTTGNINYIPLIHSFSIVGDSIYLVGNYIQSTIWTGTSGTAGTIGTLDQRSLGSDNDFLCTVKRSNGQVDNFKHFSRQPQEIASSRNYLTSLHDTVLIVQGGYFYLFDLASQLLTPPTKVLPDSSIGWFNNHDGKTIAYPLACVKDSLGNFIKMLWDPITFLPYSGFATATHFYCLANDGTVKKVNLDNGHIVSSDTVHKTGDILGNSYLSFGYSVGCPSNILSDTIMLDTFRLPNGVPKAGIVNSNLPGNQINNLHNNSAIKIYPNPASNSVNIDIDDQYLDKISDIRLMSSYGLTLGKITGNNGRTYKLDMANYPDGIYFILVKTDIGIYKVKIIKMR